MFVNRVRCVSLICYCNITILYVSESLTMDEDELFELEYHDEMEILEELENGNIVMLLLSSCRVVLPKRLVDISQRHIFDGHGTLLCDQSPSGKQLLAGLGILHRRQFAACHVLRNTSTGIHSSNMDHYFNVLSPVVWGAPHLYRHLLNQ